MKSAKDYRIFSIWVNRLVSVRGRQFRMGKYSVPREMSVDEAHYILGVGAGAKEVRYL